MVTIIEVIIKIISIIYVDCFLFTNSLSLNIQVPYDV